MAQARGVLGSTPGYLDRTVSTGPRLTRVVCTLLCGADTTRTKFQATIAKVARKESRTISSDVEAPSSPTSQLGTTYVWAKISSNNC